MMSQTTSGPQPVVTERSPSNTWTVLDLLRWTADHFTSCGIETARLDAECLLAFALGIERVGLYIDFEKPVEAAERDVFRELVRRRAKERIPVAQLLGRREFWSLSLSVTSDVLAPRPETETLVEAALRYLPAAAESRVLDLGTGSGAIALALASERPQARFVATDVSEAALAVARKNAEALGLTDRFETRQGTLFEPVAGERFDLVVSNPPYVAEKSRPHLAPELSHEPAIALFAGPEGLDVLEPLIKGVGTVLVPGGMAAIELSSEQVPAMIECCGEAGLVEASSIRDLAGRERVIVARSRGTEGPR
ncbi:peptide chain release factor N(5)-glutamine methyltransferase [Myxococcota bacterium]|nr:peptide chain release factor N(5)-glutamine methyltransferase [Myxococcota bacterium]